MSVEDFTQWCVHCRLMTPHRRTTIVDPDDSKVVVEQVKCMKCNKFETRRFGE